MFIIRYSDEHSRVKLFKSENLDYINANWIPLPFDKEAIITQGPL